MPKLRSGKKRPPTGSLRKKVSNIDPQIVGFPDDQDLNKGPLFSETPKSSPKAAARARTDCRAAPQRGLGVKIPKGGLPFWGGVPVWGDATNYVSGTVGAPLFWDVWERQICGGGGGGGFCLWLKGFILS